MVDVLRYVSGRTCYHTFYREPGLGPEFVAELVAANPDGEGFLDPRRTVFVGSLEDVYAAWELVSIGLETAEVAYGLGRVLPERGPYFPPVESWWFPELRPIELPDARRGWHWNGGFVAAPLGCRDGETGGTFDSP
jgi:hypothetical protein